MNDQYKSSRIRSSNKKRWDGKYPMTRWKSRGGLNFRLSARNLPSSSGLAPNINCNDHHDIWIMRVQVQLLVKLGWFIEVNKTNYLNSATRHPTLLNCYSTYLSIIDNTICNKSYWSELEGLYNILVTNFLLNLIIRTSSCRQQKATVHCEFHIAGARCLVVYRAAI